MAETNPCISDFATPALARVFAPARTGSNIPARIAIIAITTSISISVKPCSLREFIGLILAFSVLGRELGRRIFGETSRAKSALHINASGATRAPCPTPPIGCFQPWSTQSIRRRCLLFFILFLPVRHSFSLPVHHHLYPQIKSFRVMPVG